MRRNNVDPGRAGIEPVLLVVVQLEAAVGQAEHAAVVRVLPRQQAGAAGRTGGGGAERLAEQHALLGQALDMGRRDGVAVGLDVATRVVRVDVENIRRRAPIWSPSSYQVVTVGVESSARRCSLGTSVRTVVESAAVMPRRIRASPGISRRSCPSMRRVADAGSKSNESRASSPASPAPWPPVTSASSPRSSSGRRSWVWESGSRSPGHWARRAGSALRLHYPVARKPAPRSRLCRPSIRPWPAILNTHYPARKGGSKAPTVPRPGSLSILIPSAPGCASSASIGEATGPRAAIEPDRSERSLANARDPHRSSDRNGPATRK